MGFADSSLEPLDEDKYFVINTIDETKLILIKNKSTPNGAHSCSTSKRQVESKDVINPTQANIVLILLFALLLTKVCCLPRTPNLS